MKLLTEREIKKRKTHLLRRDPLRNLKHRLVSDYLIKVFLRSARFNHIEGSKLPKRKVSVLIMCVEGMETSPFVRRFFNSILRKQHRADDFDLKVGGIAVTSQEELLKMVSSSDFVVFTNAQMPTVSYVAPVIEEAIANGAKSDIVPISIPETALRQNRAELTLTKFMIGTVNAFNAIVDKINKGKFK